MILLSVEAYHDYAIEYDVRGKLWEGTIPDHVAGQHIEAVTIMGMNFYLDSIYYFGEYDRINFYVDDDKIIQASH